MNEEIKKLNKNLIKAPAVFLKEIKEAEETYKDWVKPFLVLFVRPIQLIIFIFFGFHLAFVVLNLGAIIIELEKKIKIPKFKNPFKK